MTLLNNFLQEPEFECIFHPAWGKQFVPISSSGSYQGVMQFILVLKFSELCRTKDTFTRLVHQQFDPVGSAALSSPKFYYVGRAEAFVRYCDQTFFLERFPLCVWTCGSLVNVCILAADQNRLTFCCCCSHRSFFKCHLICAFH